MGHRLWTSTRRIGDGRQGFVQLLSIPSEHMNNALRD